MKIIRSYIENFGKLHKYEHNFKDGLNVIKELNGWGKTTFAAFIKAIFYGLDYTTKRSINENERKKYTPWQGGNFGGNLDFEIKGKTYRIERFFGTKDKEDTFVLYDLTSNLESVDYSENIGEEIFNISREAYERSTYIPQKDLNISINDSLNAKLTNLIEDTNDINNYESAISILEKKLKYYKKIGDKGRISEIKDEINTISRSLEECIQAGEAIKIWEEKLIQKNTERVNIDKELKDIEIKINKASEYEGNAAKKHHYGILCENVDKTVDLINEKNEFFKGDLPSEEDISQCQEFISKLNNNKVIIENFKLNESEEVIYKELQSFFSLNLPNDGVLKYYNNKIDKLNLLNDKINDLKSHSSLLESDINKGKTSFYPPLILLGVIIAIIVGIISINSIPALAISLFIIAVILFSLIILRSKSKKRKLQEIINEENKLKENINKFISEKESIELEFRRFLSYFSLNYKKEEIYKIISHINANLIQYLALDERFKENERKIHEISTEQLIIAEKVNNFLDKYSSDGTYNERLENIKIEIWELKKLYSDLEKHNSSKESFESENDIAKLLALEPLDQSLDQLMKNKNSIHKEISGINEEINNIKIKINDLSNITDNQSEIESEKELLEEELGISIRKHELIEKTIKYLTKAKEQFSTHYLTDMNTGLNDYLSIINGKAIYDTKMDVKLNVKVEAYGTKREIDYYSEGYKDIIGFCSRLALVDALFKNESPFIILDDPFSNLDEEKLDNVLSLIEEISKKYQIIYFICHPSRGLEKFAD